MSCRTCQEREVNEDLRCRPFVGEGGCGDDSDDDDMRSKTRRDDTALRSQIKRARDSARHYARMPGGHLLRHPHPSQSDGEFGAPEIGAAEGREHLTMYEAPTLQQPARARSQAEMHGTAELRRPPAGRTRGGLPPSLVDRTAALKRMVAVPGREVPIGYARYRDPVIDPSNYRYVRMAGWRVAVPTTFPEWRVQMVVNTIYKTGPQSVGYVILGDTLVPADLDPGNQMALAEVAIDAEDYSLSI